VPEVWLSWAAEPNRSVDVTGFLRTKLEALAAHASQLAEGIRFFESAIVEEAAAAGRRIGVEHAEEFRVLLLTDEG
jgi:LmbE family N-acetylglucosaminyl deacetylase